MHEGKDLWSWVEVSSLVFTKMAVLHLNKKQLPNAKHPSNLDWDKKGEESNFAASSPTLCCSQQLKVDNSAQFLAKYQ